MHVLSTHATTLLQNHSIPMGHQRAQTKNIQCLNVIRCFTAIIPSTSGVERQCMNWANRECPFNSSAQLESRRRSSSMLQILHMQRDTNTKHYSMAKNNKKWTKFNVTHRRTQNTKVWIRKQADR